MLAPDGIASGMAQVGLFMDDKNAPDEFGMIFQSAINAWQATLTRKNGDLRAQSLYGCKAHMWGHAFC